MLGLLGVKAEAIDSLARAPACVSALTSVPKASCGSRCKGWVPGGAPSAWLAVADYTTWQARGLGDAQPTSNWVETCCSQKGLALWAAKVHDGGVMWPL